MLVWVLAASVEESTLFLIYLDYGNCEESEEISEVVSENFIKYENYTKSLKRFLGGPFSTPLKTHHPVHCIRTRCEHRIHVLCPK